MFTCTFITFWIEKIVDFQCQHVLCYFPLLAILQRYARVFGRNADKAKVEVKVGVEDFLAKAFEKFYIAMWSCMKLEDVLEVLPMFMPENFVDWFVFIWGREQCSKIVGQISHGSHYYLKDLKCVYDGCCGLPNGKEDQTLLIDDEPSKVIRNSKCSGFFFNHLEDKCCQRTRCNGWTLHFICGHTWLDCY